MLERVRSAAGPVLEVVPDPGRVDEIALLAGSFDPITVGHEALAAAALRRVGAVVLVYSRRTLPKEGGAAPPLLDEEQRLEVLLSFCRNRPGHAVGVTSHGLLAEHVDAAVGRFPQARIALVAGSDKVLQLLDPKWYAADRRDVVLDALFRRARMLYAERSGEEGAVEQALSLARNRAWRDRFERLAELPPSVAGVSSRRVREAVARGRDVRGLVPRETFEALSALGLVGR